MNTRNKLLVEVTLPAAQRTYDVYIQPDSLIAEIVELLNIVMSDLADGYYKPSDITLLCNADTDTILDMDKTPAELGLKHGSHVLLI